jgi:hypothetical protein
LARIFPQLRVALTRKWQALRQALSMLTISLFSAIVTAFLNQMLNRKKYQIKRILTRLWRCSMNSKDLRGGWWQAGHTLPTYFLVRGRPPWPHFVLGAPPIPEFTMRDMRKRGKKRRLQGLIGLEGPLHTACPGVPPKSRSRKKGLATPDTEELEDLGGFCPCSCLPRRSFYGGPNCSSSHPTKRSDMSARLHDYSA